MNAPKRVIWVLAVLAVMPLACEDESSPNPSSSTSSTGTGGMAGGGGVASGGGGTGGDGGAGPGDVLGCESEWTATTELWVDNENGDDGANGSQGAPVASLAAAVALASGTTTVHVQATATGYEGVCVTTDDVALMGEGGRPLVDQLVECDGRNVLLYSRADRVRFVNFELDASAFPGQSARALIFSGLPEAPIHQNMGCDIEALGPGQGQSGRSLISSSLCYDCVLEHSSSIGAEEHGIYWTNHQDGSIIRYNYVEDADGACLQLNADPETYDGGNGIQDGVMSNGLVEGNILVDCGTTGGGAALNLAGVKHTVFRNNLIYGTSMTGGIANWDDGYSSWGDSGNFAFGSSDNVFVHNTVDCRSCDRHALSFRNGSTGNTFVNNVVLTGSYDAIAVDPESNTGLVIDYNVYLPGTIFEDPDESWIELSAWQALGFDANSMTAALDEVVIDADGGDFHLAVGSPAIDAALAMDVTSDLEGNPRPQGAASDIGAYESTP